MAKKHGPAGPTIDRETLNRYVDAGLTLDEMVVRWEKETGTHRARSSFAVAMSRYGIKSAHPKPRYRQALPWRVKIEHGMHQYARMLRLLGRREENALEGGDEPKLNGFLRSLDEAGAVVHYDPLTEQGFWLVPREPVDGDGYIRVPPEPEEDGSPA